MESTIWLTTDHRLFYGGVADNMHAELAFSDRSWSDYAFRQGAQRIPRRSEDILAECGLQWSGPPELWVPCPGRPSLPPGVPPTGWPAPGL
jgi:hypothetical protein